MGLGKWLEAHGEAVCNTRPWINAAEGSTAEPSGGFSDAKKFLKLEVKSFCRHPEEQFVIGIEHEGMSGHN